MSAGAANRPPWRRRLSELGRGIDKPHAPLFAPLLYGVASQIEALPPADVTADPTRLSKCLVELRRALGTSAFVTAAPTAMEAEALGASVDRDVWPPAVTGAAPNDAIERADFAGVWGRSEALAAALETTKRLASTESGEPVFLAGLTGPARLLAELYGEGATDGAFEHAGRALSALAREFAQAGATCIVLCERTVPADVARWTGALNTIANVARFHRIPALLTFDVEGPAEWPASTIACPSLAYGGAMTRPHGLTAAGDPGTWGALVGRTAQARIVVTASDVDAGTSVDALQSACEAALELERDPASG